MCHKMKWTLLHAFGSIFLGDPIERAILPFGFYLLLNVTGEAQALLKGIRRRWRITSVPHVNKVMCLKNSKTPFWGSRDEIMVLLCLNQSWTKLFMFSFFRESFCIYLPAEDLSPLQNPIFCRGFGDVPWVYIPCSA